MTTTRRRLVGMVAALLSVTVLLSGCSTSSKSKPKFKPRPTTGLASHLEHPPEFSTPGGSRWSVNYTPSTSTFVSQFYDPAVRKKATAMLDAQRLKGIAHILWITDDRIQCDLVLLQFSDAAGARQRLDGVLGINNEDGSLTSYSLDAPGAPIIYYASRADAQGYTAMRGYALVGDIVVEMFLYSPTGLQKPLAERWLSTQAGMVG